MNISLLADHPQFIEILAPWIVAHWRPILPQETVESRVQKFKTHLNRDALPIAWVAHSGSQVYGTAALRAHDLHGYDHLTPWLGGVYVAPPFRRRGIGAALCAAVERQATIIFGVRTLYLLTLDKQSWYRNTGWHPLASCTWHDRAGDTLFKETRVV